MNHMTIRSCCTLLLAALITIASVGCGGDAVTSSTPIASQQSSGVPSQSAEASSPSRSSPAQTSTISSTASVPSAGVISSGSKNSSSSVSSKPKDDSMKYGDIKAVAYKPQVIPSMTATLNVNPARVINANIIGGGVNFSFSDYVYFDFISESGFNLHLPFRFGYEEAEKEAWDEFLKMIDFTGMQYVRLQVSYTQWEPINDNNNPSDTDFDKGFIFSPNFKKRIDSAKVPENTYRYMEYMYKLLDYFEKKNIFVILGNWSGGQAASGFCPGGNVWLKSESTTKRDGLYVKSVDEFAESFAAIMYHLIKEKKYTCVKGFSIFNEPEHFNNIENVLTDVYNKCGAHLTRLGIRDKVMIQAFDGPIMWNNQHGEGTGTLERMLKSCGSNMDILSLHHYVSTIEAGPISGQVQGTIQSRLMKGFVEPTVRLSGGRPVIVGELGTFAYTTNAEATPKDYRLPIFNAEASTAIFNAGVKGYGLWVYNTHIHTHFSMLEPESGNAYRLIPDGTNFYPNSLMMKYLPAGTNIVQNTVTGGTLSGKQRVFATVGTKGGNTTILLVNDSDEPASVTIQGVDTSKTYQHHFVSKGKTDRIYPGVAQNLKNNATVALRPQSITVLTTYTYGTQTVRFN